MRGKILIVDDDRSTCELLHLGLSNRGYEVCWRTEADEALAVVHTAEFDVVVTDLHMPKTDGIELCNQITASRPNLPVIVITAFGNLNAAVAAIRAGAYDFVTKPFEIDQLTIALDRAVNHKRLHEEIKRLRDSCGMEDTATPLLGNSAPMRALRAIIRKVAGTDTSVLIMGETGTGKELVARELHNLSHRAAGPFVPINCAAFPDTLLESEMFGHVRGAFTDAKAARTGLFLQANKGTLFLDEIGNMSLNLQPKFLRVLQERAVRPVGGNEEAPFDTRIVSATNADLEDAVEEGRFRQDLYYRLNVVHIVIPPLRERGSDVLLLAQHFIHRFATQMGKEVKGMSEPAAERIQGFDWPGNVRQLQNAIERAVALTTHEVIMVEDLPDSVRLFRPTHITLGLDNAQDFITLEDLEARYIKKVLEAVRGNKTEAARILGLDRRTLYRKLDKSGS